MKTDLSLFPFSIRRINITIKTKLTQGGKKRIRMAEKFHILSKFRINFKYSTKLISPFNFSSHFPRFRYKIFTSYDYIYYIYIYYILAKFTNYQIIVIQKKKKKYLHVHSRSFSFKRFPIIKKIKQRQDRSV